MKIQKNLGIWMDHLNAILIDLDAKEKSHTITSKFNYDVQDEAISKGEKGMYNKRQRMREAYYKEIADVSLNYDNMLLFGPTDAKAELHNYLNKNSHFKDKKIEIKAADQLTDNQKEAFVKSHFEKETV